MAVWIIVEGSNSVMKGGFYQVIFNEVERTAPGHEVLERQDNHRSAARTV